MFVVFDKVTKNAVFTASCRFSGMEDYIVIETENEDFNLNEVCAQKELGQDGIESWVIVKRCFDKEAEVRKAKQSKMKLLQVAQDNISLLRDVMEMSLEETDDAKLTAWKKYRIAVYHINTAEPDNIVWPEMPVREV